MSDIDSSRASVVTEPRTPGYDVARAIAVLGMIMVDFRHELLVYDGASALLWLFDGVEGKAAALFVVLAGVGISLRTQRGDVDDCLPFECRPLLERAALLIGAGLLLLHVWKYDILHFHGIYLLLALPLVRARSSTLWMLAIGSIWVALLLNNALDWTEPPTLTITGALRHVFFNGLYPVFPWMAFVLVGMAVGRLDLADDRVRRSTMVIALGIALLTCLLDALGRHEQRTGALGIGGYADWLLTWPRAPRPFFVVSGCAVAVALICACISVTRGRADRRWVLALVATGQMAFTLYVGHVVAILVPVQHGLLRGLHIELAFAYALAFYVAAIAFALWWRRRWPQGPLEAVIRQVTARPEPPDGVRLRAR